MTGRRCYKQVMVEVPPAIAQELAPSEKVLWTGHPRQGLALHAYDAFALPFGFVWLGIVLINLSEMVQTARGDPIAIAMLVIFVGVGLYMVAGRFFVEAKQRSRVFYAVTNERIVIVSGLLSRTMKSVALKTLSEMAVSERRSGSGSIVFGPTGPFDWMYMPGWPGMGSRMAARFDLIPNVRAVYETIRRAQQALSK
jgi:hypothetical protein